MTSNVRDGMRDILNRDGGINAVAIKQVVLGQRAPQRLIVGMR
jgi:hypothetical protein